MPKKSKGGICNMCKTKKIFIVATLLVGILLWCESPNLKADDPWFAPCPKQTPPSGNPPSSIVVVTILSIKPNTDLEGDDDFVPFYDNRPDIYGHVTIDGEEHKLPQIEDSDFPHWDIFGIFRKKVDSSPVSISIDIWESDGGLTFGDDHVDINPAPEKSRLDFAFDLCSLKLLGDVTSVYSTQGIIKISGGSGDDAATIRFKVELEDGRPVTADDIALVEVDLVQVIHKSTRLISRKPTVVMVRMANNFSVPVSTNLRIQIFGPGVSIEDVFPIDIEPGEVKKQYLYTDSPLLFPASASPYDIAVLAELEDPGSPGLQSDDCRRANDGNINRIIWKVVTTHQDFSFLWMKVGTLLDIGNYTPDSHFNEIFELGQSFIEATYPLVLDPPTDISPIPLSPPISAAVDWFVTILSSFEIPADAFEPFVLTFELNSVAVLVGYDRLMGVLPNKDWLRRFKFWDDVTGLSLGEFAPHAVIFLPRDESESGGDVGPQMTLPAHELGHTFGLSTDPTLKESWVCDVDWPVVGSLPCGIAGGFDEYERDDPVLKKGNPSRGYWVAQEGEPSSLLPLLNQEQCNSHCFMGNSPRNAHLNWNTKKRWIDAADYDHLVEGLSIHPDPEVIYVSGMISWSDQIYLGPWYRLPQGIPDREDEFGLYALRFIDRQGNAIQEIGLPIYWNVSDSDLHLPVTFFGMLVPYPRQTNCIEIWNRGTGKLLAKRNVSRNIPKVRIKSQKRDQTVQQRASLLIEWEGKDEDRDELSYTLLISPDNEKWWPVAHKLTTKRYNMQIDVLSPGTYFLKVLASDGVHVGESQIMRFYVQARR